MTTTLETLRTDLDSLMKEAAGYRMVPTELEDRIDDAGIALSRARDEAEEANQSKESPLYSFNDLMKARAALDDDGDTTVYILTVEKKNGERWDMGGPDFPEEGEDAVKALADLLFNGATFVRVALEGSGKDAQVVLFE